jgi:hypothetical protein
MALFQTHHHPLKQRQDGVLSQTKMVTPQDKMDSLASGSLMVVALDARHVMAHHEGPYQTPKIQLGGENLILVTAL